MNKLFKKILVVQALYVFTFFGFTSALISPLAIAAPRCIQLFQTKSSILNELATTPVTVAQVSFENKKIPLILVNHNSVASLSSIYNKSIGFAVAHQRGSGNDHGLFRLGEFFIDRDAPGLRARGEINSTGISWASVPEYVLYNHKKGGGNNRVEVLFELSESEYNTAALYQKMRRAALVRPDFSFGRDSNPRDANNRITESSENCFSFCTGASTSSHLRIMRSKIKEIIQQDLDTILNSEEMKNYIHTIKNYMLNSDLSDTQLNPNLTSQFESPNSIKNLNLDRAVETELLNWIIGLKLSEDYSDLLNSLDVHNSSDFSNVRSARASAVLIYDSFVSLDYFLTDKYYSVGAFSTWQNQDLTVFQKETPKISLNKLKKFFGF